MVILRTSLIHQERYRPIYWLR